MRTLIAGDTASSFGTCSKLLSHGRVIYQISIFDAIKKIRKFKFVRIRKKQVLSEALDIRNYGSW